MKNKSSMYVLQLLDDPAFVAKPNETLSVEYRLLCSGTVHRNIIGDWSKSEGSRFLFDLTGVFCTSGSEREFTLEGSGCAEK
jgi:hypothetical protein